jgi:hypothetical protein
MPAPAAQRRSVSVTRIIRATHLVFVGVALLASASGALAQGARCSVPDKSFESFLARFSENEHFRSGRIAFPVIYRHGRFENGDLQAQLWDAERVTALGTPPLFLSRTQRAARDVVQELPLVTKDYAEVYHRKREGDSYEVTFAFRRHGGCWFLEGLHDTSL